MVDQARAVHGPPATRRAVHGPEWYRGRYNERLETYEAYVEVWTTSPEATAAFHSWAGFSQAANGEPAQRRERVQLAEAIIRAAGFEVADPTRLGARQWRPRP